MVGWHSAAGGHEIAEGVGSSVLEVEVGVVLYSFGISQTVCVSIPL